MLLNFFPLLRTPSKNDDVDWQACGEAWPADRQRGRARQGRLQDGGEEAWPAGQRRGGERRDRRHNEPQCVKGRQPRTRGEKELESQQRMQRGREREADGDDEGG
ncbi:protein argonaute-2-like [Entelurus aequoreus]|uniref:protein argonaute-2-like n=1 Tax=Entelurus aequoreus TaxID=161455 RepID=UPI002B1D6DC4|nr:protein argonaute-2-like [Entelurus aequoreus]